MAPAEHGAGDWIEIVQLTTRMAWLTDRRDWDSLPQVFAEQVDLDYASLTGQPPTQLPPTDIVTAWRAGLGALDATQHLLSNHLVDVTGERAVATAQFQAVHVLANPHGDPTWTLGGHYRFGLVRSSAGWRIDKLAMTVTWATGNQQIMTPGAEPKP